MNRAQRRSAASYERPTWSVGVFGDGIAAVAALHQDYDREDPATATRVLRNVVATIAYEAVRRGFVVGTLPPLDPPEPRWFRWEVDSRSLRGDLPGGGFVLLQAPPADWHGVLCALCLLLEVHGPLTRGTPREGLMSELAALAGDA